MSAVAEETSRLIVDLDHTEKAAAMAALTDRVLARNATDRWNNEPPFVPAPPAPTSIDAERARRAPTSAGRD